MLPERDNHAKSINFFYAKKFNLTEKLYRSKIHIVVINIKQNVLTCNASQNFLNIKFF